MKLWLAAFAAAWALCAHAGDAEMTAWTALKARIESGEIPGIHGVLVLVDGKTVVEWYFAGQDETIGERGPIALPHVAFGADTLHDVRSVTKSVVSILFGIAYSDGAIKNLDAPVFDYFPELADLRTPDRMKVRVRDVLTMSSGLHWDERTYPYTDARNSEIAMDIAADPYRYVLSQTVDAPPGTRFNYSGGDVALVAAIVTRATGTPIETYAQRKLFGPLGIPRFEWSKGNGIPRAASGLRLTPRDMGKIGVMMLRGGRWGDVQVVPGDWVDTSTSVHIHVEGDPVCGTNYGYLWWLNGGCTSSPAAASFAGIGNGGQRIWVVPSRKLVVAVTAGLYNDPNQAEAATTLLAGVLAAVDGGSAAAP
jgi:CubicO group peptidase (beta-lactamase class C family)